MTYAIALVPFCLMFAEAAPTPSAAEIMAKVAANQDRASAARSRYVYSQKLRARMIRTNGKLAREEFRTYTVTPVESGKSEKKLTEFKGVYESKGKLHNYTEPGFEYKDVDIDGDVIDDLADDLVNDEKSRDGISADLFPLTGEEQKKYEFKLAGELVHQGRKAYRITFTPRKKQDASWTGEAIVDRGIRASERVQQVCDEDPVGREGVSGDRRETARILGRLPARRAGRLVSGELWHRVPARCAVRLQARDHDESDQWRLSRGPGREYGELRDPESMRFAATRLSLQGSLNRYRRCAIRRNVSKLLGR